MNEAIAPSRSMAVLGVTAVLFFLALLPFELIPEIPVDIDSKPFFLPLAFCALLPARQTALAIGLGVALGEGLRDLMEGYELDDPIGFFGYVIGFWAASHIYAIAPRNKLLLVFGAIVCAFVQAAFEASSFLLFGAEALSVAVWSAFGNTITHGVIWGAIPLLFLVPALRGRFERHLGFAPLGAPIPEPLRPPDDNSVAFLAGVSFRRPGDQAPILNDVSLDLRPGERIGVTAPDGEATARWFARVISGTAPKATGGEIVGHVGVPRSVSFVSGAPADLFTQPRAAQEVAAALIADGAAPKDALRRAREALADIGLGDDKADAYVWELDRREQALTLIAAAKARGPDLLVIDDLPEALGDDWRDALKDLLDTRPAGAASIVIDHDAERLAPFVERTISLQPQAPGDEAPDTDTDSPAAASANNTVAEEGEAKEDDAAPGGKDGPIQVPTLQTSRGVWWGKRDPRVKWIIFITLLVMIYVAPDWRWMAAMCVLGLVMARTARPPLAWLGFALFVQAPNIIGLLLLPLLGDGAGTAAEVAFGLRLCFGWIAAILFGVSLLSTMDPPAITAGLRGVGLPRRFSFAVGYAFVLIYLSAADFMKAVSDMGFGEGGLSIRRPIALLRAAPSLIAPIVETVARRGGVMAVALEANKADRRPAPHAFAPLTLSDVALAFGAFALLGLAIAARLG
ncbi:MAG: hypothetical protein AAFX08_01915 [Pseudomonadota bacterium]